MLTNSIENVLRLVFVQASALSLSYLVTLMIVHWQRPVYLLLTCSFDFYISASSWCCGLLCLFVFLARVCYACLIHEFSHLTLNLWCSCLLTSQGIGQARNYSSLDSEQLAVHSFRVSRLHARCLSLSLSLSHTHTHEYRLKMIMF